MSESSAAGQLSTRAEAVFVFGTIAMERGGVTRTILSRMRLFAEAGVRVRLLLTAHAANEDSEAAAVRKAWSLPDSVEIRYFWREAAPGGGGSESEPQVHQREEPGMTSFTEPGNEQAEIVRFYDNGALAKAKHFDEAGQLFRIDHYDIARRVIMREYFDPHGRLVRADGVSPDQGHPTIRRWFDRSGDCWLTSWLNKAGQTQATVRHKPTPHAYDTFGQCAAEWVDEVLADSADPVVFSDTRAMDTVLRAMKHSSAHKVAVLHNVHTSKPHRPQDPTKSTWLPLFSGIEEFDAVVVLTERQRADIAERYGATNLTVINHPTPPQTDVAVPRQPGLLVAVARLETQKRLEDAIKAFAIAAKSVPEARFDIYGTGSEATKLRTLVAELQLSDRVRFPGFTDRAIEVFASASATVLSSWFEGFPLVLNEAMAVGTPFVSYNLNYGPDEVIRHEVDGLLVPYGDIDALAAAMVGVLGDPGYAEQLGKRAREVVDRFSIERWQREWTDLITRLADGHASTAMAAPTVDVGRSNAEGVAGQ